MVVERTGDGDYAQTDTPLASRKSLAPFATVSGIEGFDKTLPHRVHSAQHVSDSASDATNVSKHRAARPQHPLDFDSFDSIQSDDQGNSSSTSTMASPNAGVPTPGNPAHSAQFFTIASNTPSLQVSHQMGYGSYVAATATSTPSYFGPDDHRAAHIEAGGLITEGQTYLPRMPTMKSMFPVSEDSWDMKTTTVSEDIYASMMTMDPLAKISRDNDDEGSESRREPWPWH